MINKSVQNKLYDAITNKSYSDGQVVVLGELFELRFDDDGSAVSVYKYRPQEEIERLNEEEGGYDFDDDFLTTIYF
jgi:hypothetical protein